MTTSSTGLSLPTVDIAIDDPHLLALIGTGALFQKRDKAVVVRRAQGRERVTTHVERPGGGWLVERVGFTNPGDWVVRYGGDNPLKSWIVADASDRYHLPASKEAQDGREVEVRPKLSVVRATRNPFGSIRILERDGTVVYEGDEHSYFVCDFDAESGSLGRVRLVEVQSRSYRAGHFLDTDGEVLTEAVSTPERLSPIDQLLLLGGDKVISRVSLSELRRSYGMTQEQAESLIPSCGREQARDGTLWLWATDPQGGTLQAVLDRPDNQRTLRMHGYPTDARALVQLWSRDQVRSLPVRTLLESAAWGEPSLSPERVLRARAMRALYRDQCDRGWGNPFLERGLRIDEQRRGVEAANACPCPGERDDGNVFDDRRAALEIERLMTESADKYRFAARRGGASTDNEVPQFDHEALLALARAVGGDLVGRVFQPFGRGMEQLAAVVEERRRSTSRSPELANFEERVHAHTEFWLEELDELEQRVRRMDVTTIGSILGDDVGDAVRMLPPDSARELIDAIRTPLTEAVHGRRIGAFSKVFRIQDTVRSGAGGKTHSARRTLCDQIDAAIRDESHMFVLPRDVRTPPQATQLVAAIELAGWQRQLTVRKQRLDPVEQDSLGAAAAADRTRRDDAISALDRDAHARTGGGRDYQSLLVDEASANHGIERTNLQLPGREA